MADVLLEIINSSTDKVPYIVYLTYDDITMDVVSFHMKGEGKVFVKWGAAYSKAEFGDTTDKLNGELLIEETTPLEKYGYSLKMAEVKDTVDNTMKLTFDQAVCFRFQTGKAAIGPGR